MRALAALICKIGIETIDRGNQNSPTSDRVYFDEDNRG